MFLVINFWKIVSSFVICYVIFIVTHLSFCFVPIEESAIAKGIRRIIGVTGTAALSAQELGSQLEVHVADLQARLHELQLKKSVDVEGLDALVTQLRYFILIYSTS